MKLPNSHTRVRDKERISPKMLYLVLLFLSLSLALVASAPTYETPKVVETCVEYSLTYTREYCENNSTSCVTEEIVEEWDGEPCTRNIYYQDLIIDFREQGYECSRQAKWIICDSLKDGNGDGKCQDGETCCTLDENANMVCLNGDEARTVLRKLEVLP